MANHNLQNKSSPPLVSVIEVLLKHSRTNSVTLCMAAFVLLVAEEGSCDLMDDRGLTADADETGPFTEKFAKACRRINA